MKQGVEAIAQKAILKSKDLVQEVRRIQANNKAFLFHGKIWAEQLYHFQNAQAPFGDDIEILSRQAVQCQIITFAKKARKKRRVVVK